MISRSQQILLKRAQAQSGLDDSDYRSAIETLTALPHCRSSKDPRLTDAHVDNLLSYFEAIYWRAVDSGQLKEPCNPNAVFRQRGYWASKNQRGNTSRDRYTSQSIPDQVNALEQEMFSLGFNFHYCAAIRNRTTTVRGYMAALQRTIRAKRSRQRDEGASRGLSATPELQDSNTPF